MGESVVKTIYKAEYADLLILLRQKRLDAGVTQVDLCRKLDVPNSFVGKVERGERRLDVIELQAICRILGIKLQALMDELDQRQRR